MMITHVKSAPIWIQVRVVTVEANRDRNCDDDDDNENNHLFDDPQPKMEMDSCDTLELF